MKLGSTQINKMFLGSTEIKKAYLGASLVAGGGGGGPVVPGSYYLRPDGVSLYLRPDGVSLYLRPGSSVVNTLAPWIDNEFPYPGSMLRAFPGSWTGSPSLSYQWTRDGAVISGATSETYVATLDDADHTVSCTITESGGNSVATQNSVAISGTHLDTGLPLDANGYHDIDAIINRPGKYTDSRIIYFDPTGGNDDTAVNYNKTSPELNGTPTTPGAVLAYASIGTARSQLRSGYADVLLCKRGELIDNGSDMYWQGYNGKSLDERLILSCYGESGSLPLVKNHCFLRSSGGSPMHFILLTNWGCYYSINDPDSPEFVEPGDSGTGVKLLGSNTVGLFIEGVMSRFAQWDFQATLTAHIRRNVILDNYAVGSHGQGLYADSCVLTIEECFFDHNGWNTTVPGAGKTKFNHNMYLNGDAPEPTVIGNLSSRAASHGIQQRGGGITKNNLFLDNAIHILSGGGTTPVVGGVPSFVDKNVIIGSTPIGTSPRGYSISLTNVNEGRVSKNVIAHKPLKTYNDFGIDLGSQSGSGGPDTVGVNNVDIFENLTWDWKGGMRFPNNGATEPLTPPNYWNVSVTNNKHYEPSDAFIINSKAGTYSQVILSSNKFHRDTGTGVANVDGTYKTLSNFNALLGYTGVSEWDDHADYAVPTISDYMLAIGETGGLEEFINGCRAQSVDTWDARYTPAAFNAYIRSACKINPIG